MAPRCATLDLVVVVFLAVTGRGTTKNANPDRCCDRGFSLFCRVALTYQEPPLRSGDDANNPFLEPRVSSNCQASAALRR